MVVVQNCMMMTNAYTHTHTYIYKDRVTGKISNPSTPSAAGSTCSAHARARASCS